MVHTNSNARIRLAQSAVLATLVVNPFGSAAVSETVSAKIEIESATVDPLYDPLLVPRKRGWLGADGAMSIPLTDQRTLWIFGDSILGTLTSAGKKQGPIVRNTIALHDFGGPPPGTVEFYWDLSDNVPGAFFHPESFAEDYWYWPGVGAMVDGELFLFLYKLESGAGEPGFEFKMVDTTLCRISNPLDPPRDWKISFLDLGLGHAHQGFCSAILVERPYLYLLGFDDGPEDDPTKRAAILSRAPIDDLKGGAGGAAFEFWSKGEKSPAWSRNHENPQPLFSPGATESSLQYDPEKKQYLCVTQFPFQTGMYILTASNLTGPWSRPLKVYDVPEPSRNENYHAYAMKSHPELAASPNELVITYVVNTTDFWSMFSDPAIYYPRFVRVRMR